MLLNLKRNRGDIVANQNNLVPLTTEKAREIGKKGGIRSGEVKREKATFKNAIKWLIESDIKIDKGNLYDSFKQSGIDISKLNTTQLATLGLWYGAVTGNASNYKTMMEANNEITEENSTSTPTLKIEVIDNSKLEGAMYEENKHNKNDN